MWRLVTAVSAIVIARAVYIIAKKPQAYCASCGTCYPQSAEWVKCSACDKKTNPPVATELQGLMKVFKDIEEVLAGGPIPDNSPKPNTEEKSAPTSV